MLEEKGLIKTTGPHMRRFFFSVEDAASLVIRAMNNIETTAGKVLSKKMKAAQIEDILKLFVEMYNGKYEKVSERPGESIDETLIGESELVYTREIFLNEIEHYLISFNEKSPAPISGVINSANADRLEKDEMLSIISNPPKYF
jgi:FlaA1/EpsC-like NDP-sugar epimerase